MTKCDGRAIPLGTVLAVCQLSHVYTGSLPLIISGSYMLLQSIITHEKYVAINNIGHFLEIRKMFDYNEI